VKAANETKWGVEPGVTRPAGWVVASGGEFNEPHGNEEELLLLHA
jgi:hypothetical protein